MTLCVENKFIFIHIPKNSGSAMTKAILKTYRGSKIRYYQKTERHGPNIGIDKMHLYYEVIDKFIPRKILNEYIKFCIIRNPYDRLYSAWNFIKERHGYSDVNDFVKYKLNKEFIYGKEIKQMDARVHYRPQYTFIYDEKNKQFIDYIIRYENLNEDLSKFNKKYNFDIRIYGKDYKFKKSYINFFNKESLKKINELYKKDFLLLNYKMIN